MQTKYSKGNWKVVVGDNPNKTLTIVAEQRNPDYPVKSNCGLLVRHIAAVSVHGPREENEANARLLAASRDLYDAAAPISAKFAALMASKPEHAAADHPTFAECVTANCKVEIQMTVLEWDFLLSAVRKAQGN